MLLPTKGGLAVLLRDGGGLAVFFLGKGDALSSTKVGEDGAPLFDMIGEDANFCWSIDREEAFEGVSSWSETDDASEVGGDTNFTGGEVDFNGCTPTLAPASSVAPPVNPPPEEAAGTLGGPNVDMSIRGFLTLGCDLEDTNDGLWIREPETLDKELPGRFGPTSVARGASSSESLEDDDEDEETRFCGYPWVVAASRTCLAISWGS